MRECVDEAVLQSYVDDELSTETASDVAAHVSACHACAGALNEIINENAIFARAFEAEIALDVPTVRLRERIDEAIAGLNNPARDVETKQGWSLSDWFASVAGFFKASPQRALSFAGLIIVIAFAAIFAAIQLRYSSSGGNQPSVVAVNNGGTRISPSPIVTSSPEPKATPTPDNNGEKPAPSKDTKQKKQSKPILVPEPDQLQKADLAVSKPLPGEANYLKAIDALKTEIEASGETAMKPSLRAEYERNMAVLDQAINTTQRTARRHPKDQDAAEFLYASYQSKLDLLTAVAEQVRPAIASR